jgi:MYXO-CTERM domain-containing protein
MAFWFECLALLALLYTWRKPSPEPSSSTENPPSPWPLRAVAALALLLAAFLWFQSTRQPLQHSPHPQLAAYLSKQVPADQAVAWHDRLLPEGRAQRNLSLVSAFVSSDFPFYVPAIPEYAQRRALITHLETPTAADVALLRKGKVSHAVLPDTMVADRTVWKQTHHLAPYRIFVWRR